jgi:hypothetical protein
MEIPIGSVARLMQEVAAIPDRVYRHPEELKHRRFDSCPRKA